MSGCDHLDDAALIAAFDTLAIRPEDFHHREHVRLAFALLVRERDLAAAAGAFRRTLKRFADAAGAPGKYHETITWAYLAIIAERMQQRAYASSRELIDANPDLLDHRGGALARHYDVAELLASPLARAAFVLPRR
ncbi:MAG: hypothetical protein ACM31C_33775 [Acidobacteriota bacterium]